MNHTLVSIIESGLEYSDSWAVYAAENDPYADARLGQTEFENGGILDGFELVATNMDILDYLAVWSEGEEEIDYEIFVIDLLDEMKG